MAITDKEEGVWNLDEVYNKQNQGGIWDYDGIPAYFTMGFNRYGASGLNVSLGDKKSSPTQLPGTTWSKITATAGYGFQGLKTDGTAWAWGYNDKGALGVGDSHDNGNNYSSPTHPPAAGIPKQSFFVHFCL